MRLLGNRLLVEPVRRTQTESGIHIPEQYNDDRMQWKVLAVGTGRTTKTGALVPIEIPVGAHILTPMYHGDHYAFDDGRKIIDADEVMAVWL
jgi:chaperonin GroES